MSDMPPDLSELYLTFGITAEKAQVMETAAGNVALAYVTFFFDTSKLTPEITERFKCLIKDINSKPFGVLLRTIKKSIQIDDKTLAIVDEALEKRNYITHSFFRHHNFAIHSEEGRRIMIDELTEIGRKFDLAHFLLEGLADGLHQLAGRPPNLGLEEGLRLEARGKRVNI
jgi:hypothetical protein